MDQSNINEIKNSIITRLRSTNYKLYKYRTCSIENFDTLREQYIWLPLAKDFPDAMDCIVKYAENENIGVLRKWFSVNGFEWNFYQTIINKQKELNIISNKERLKELFNAISYKHGSIDRCHLYNVLYNFFQSHKIASELSEYFITIDNMIDTKEDIFDFIIENYQKQARGAAQRGKNRLYVLSLAEDYAIPSMWDVYSAQKTGYCVEYDFSKCIDDLNNYQWLASLARVQYKTKSIFSLIDVFKRMLDNCLLNTVHKELYAAREDSMEMQLYVKDPSYAFEKEWRVIMLSDGKPQKYPFPYINAIYVGINISKENLQQLRKICQNLNIPLFLQKLNEFGNNYIYEKDYAT